jgi:hypothetical protein
MAAPTAPMPNMHQTTSGPLFACQSTMTALPHVIHVAVSSEPTVALRKWLIARSPHHGHARLGGTACRSTCISRIGRSLTIDTANAWRELVTQPDSGSVFSSVVRYGSITGAPHVGIYHPIETFGPRRCRNGRRSTSCSPSRSARHRAFSAPRRCLVRRRTKARGEDPHGSRASARRYHYWAAVRRLQPA